MSDHVYQQCINPDCSATFDVGQALVGCSDCGSLLDVQYDWSKLRQPTWKLFESRRVMPSVDHAGLLDLSGVWRFRDLLPFYQAPSQVVTIGEGRTLLQDARRLAQSLGMQTTGRLYLQYEGYNPSGSFKDNGMTAAFTHARMLGASRVACASTGNTSAALALYARQSGCDAYVFIGSGKIAYGKLSQALDYGAKTLQIEGDFDTCLHRVRQIATQVPALGIYLMNSVNPFRLEGQKAIMYRVLESLLWQPPDWIVVPGGNLGNCSAFAKAFAELKELGLIKRIPRLAVIQAKGANPLYTLYALNHLRWNGGRWDTSAKDDLYAMYDRQGIRAKTVASAIEIGRPVNLAKALRALDIMDGVVREVDDQAILEHKAQVGRDGYGCEPASAASVAGARQLIEEGVIGRDERVVCILTGHQLKDPDATVNYHTGIDVKAVQDQAPRTDPWGSVANRPIAVPDDLGAIIQAMGGDPALADGLD